MMSAKINKDKRPQGKRRFQMKKYILLGIVIGLLAALVIGYGVATTFAQGPNPNAPTVEQMKAWHESMHGAGTWDAMAQQMEQVHGKDWFNQMHGPNGYMNGMMNGQNPMGNGMMNGQNHMGNGNWGGMMTPPAKK
jgi:hypothetical protein